MYTYRVKSGKMDIRLKSLNEHCAAYTAIIRHVKKGGGQLGHYISIQGVFTREVFLTTKDCLDNLKLTP